MKAGESDLEVGTVVKVLAITSGEIEDAIGVVGTIGEVTHPFGDQPDTIVGLWVRQWGTVPPGVTFPDNRIGLCVGDQVEVVETNHKLTL